MKLLPLSDVRVRSRQRSEIASGPLRELKDSILERGLLHPPVVHYDRSAAEYVLVAGERRFRAISEIATEGLTFVYGTQLVPPGEIPVNTIDLYEEADVLSTELEENTRRVDLPMMDRVKALATIHELRKADNPLQTHTQTAIELVKPAETKPGLPPGQSESRVNTVRREISRAIVIAAQSTHDSVAKARNEKEAFNNALKLQEEAATAELRKRRGSRTTSNDIRIIHGDSLNILPTLSEASVDLILTDPPYGIGADTASYRQRTAQHHNYDDSPETALELQRLVLLEGFRICRPRAHLFMFMDFDSFTPLRNHAQRCGWDVFRTPLIWQKSISEGLRPWGAGGPARTYDVVLYARKGEKTLYSPLTDVLFAKRVPRDERLFAGQKPTQLLDTLINLTTLPGDMVLDPCCGSGATLNSARRLKRRGLGIELSEVTYNTAMSHIFKEDT